MKKLKITRLQPKGFFSTLMIIISAALLISIAGCSTGMEQNYTANQQSFSGDKSFSFKDNGSDWRVDFDDDDISAIYKDGARLPDNEIEEYREMIYDKINGLKTEQYELSDNVHKFNFDMEKFQDQMKNFKKDFDNDKFLHFNLEFDQDDFDKNIEELEEKLSELNDKKIEIYFDSDAFNENMKELEENLKNLPPPPVPPQIDIEAHIDMQKFKESMKKLKEELKSSDIKIDASNLDLSELRENMKELKNNLKGLKIKISGVESETKNLTGFLDELKKELYKDGYINSIDDNYNIEMSEDKTEINGTPIKDFDHQKYKKIYKKYFSRELNGTIKLNRD